MRFTWLVALGLSVASLPACVLGPTQKETELEARLHMLEAEASVDSSTAVQLRESLNHERRISALERNIMTLGASSNEVMTDISQTQQAIIQQIGRLHPPKPDPEQE